MTGQPARDPAVLRYDGQDRADYRPGMAPEGLNTAAQLRSWFESPPHLAA